MTELDQRLVEPRTMSFVYDMIQERASEDEAFRASLLKQPKVAIKEAFGVDVADNLEVKVYEMHETTGDDGAAIGHIVLPPPSKLSDEQLKGVAGAAWGWKGFTDFFGT